ncbi:MAG: F-box protein [Parachlamydiales bacterium]|nr:F-box protein [Parachlamydiales bacterium]
MKVTQDLLPTSHEVIFDYFPSEIIQKILSFLSVLDKTRMTLTSKYWYQFICNPLNPQSPMNFITKKINDIASVTNIAKAGFRQRKGGKDACIIDSMDNLSINQTRILISSAREDSHVKRRLNEAKDNINSKLAKFSAQET